MNKLKLKDKKKQAWKCSNCKKYFGLVDLYRINDNIYCHNCYVDYNKGL